LICAKYFGIVNFDDAAEVTLN